MEKNIEQSINKVHKKKFLCLGRATNLLWIQFGNILKLKNFKNEEIEKGEYVFHIQCPWRFIQKNKILLGNEDIYQSEEYIENFDWTKKGTSIFDKKESSINELLKNTKVKEVYLNSLGDLKIIFTNEVIFEVFLNTSLKMESYRFINNKTREHFVIFE